MIWSVTAQVYVPSSPGSVGSTRRLLFTRKVNLAEGVTVAPSLSQRIETGFEAVKVQSNRAGLPSAIAISEGGVINSARKGGEMVVPAAASLSVYTHTGHYLEGRRTRKWVCLHGTS